MWPIFFIFFLQIISGYIEHVEIKGCESCALRLICRDLKSIIAVLEAKFEPFEENSILPTAFPPFHPRLALNRRCSGVNYCSFILTKDCPGADEWGSGNLTVKYACISDNRVTKHCNKKIVLPGLEKRGISRGFVHSPSYPRFYLGKQKCKWRIQAQYPQKVKIVIIDLALIGSPGKQGCTDLIEVSDSGQIIYSTCEQREPPEEIISLGNSLEVTLLSSPSEVLLPSRGILFYYTAFGCPTPLSPHDGYLVYRNDTSAEFSCCIGFVFPDTKTRRRIISCLGHKWDIPTPLPNCFDSKLIENSQLIDLNNPKELATFDKKMANSNTMQEIVIPTIIMVGLFVINAVVLFVIHRYRSRKEVELEEEEMGTLPITKN